MHQVLQEFCWKRRKVYVIFIIVLAFSLFFPIIASAQFDVTLPTFTVTNVTGCTVTIDVSDPGGQCAGAGCGFFWDTATWITGTVYQGSNSYTYSSNGDYNLDWACGPEPCASSNATVVHITSCGGASDVTPPVVTITNPSTDPYTTSNPAIDISGTATDDTGVSDLRGFVNGSLYPVLSAIGGPFWSMSSVPLNPGSNTITVEAEDSAGNVGSDSITVIYQADTTPPTITITSPTNQPTYVTTTQPISLAGTASDDTGVTSVTWSDNRGNSGTATGTTSWSISSIPLVPGTTLITVTAHDGAGNTSSDTISVSYTPPDLAPPTVTITGPSSLASFTVTSQVVTLSGTMSDDVGVTQITWQDNHGNSGIGVITGANSWTIPGILLLPEPETNVITVTAYDASEKTGSDTITLIYTPAGVRSEGNLSAISMDLNFVYPYEPGMGADMYENLSKQVTVPRNATDLVAVARIEYSGTGHLTGFWKVDGQILSAVELDLPQAGGIDIFYPPPYPPGFPPLPTYDSGPHQVTFDIVGPESMAGISEPVITYYVETSASSSPGAWRIGLISPSDGSYIPFPHLTGNDMTLTWTKLPGDYTYRWVILSGDTGEILLQGEVENTGTVVLPSDFSASGFSDNAPYKWKVIATTPNGTTAGQSRLNTFYFSIPEDEGAMRIRNFRIEKETGTGLQPVSPRRIQGPGSLLDLFFPREAEAAFGMFTEMSVYGSESGGEVDRVEVSPGDTVSITFNLKNDSTTLKTNILVKLFVDGRDNLVDSYIVPQLAAGEEKTIRFTYTVEDSYTHTLEVVVSQMPAGEEVVLATREGFLVGQEDSPPETHDTPPDEGYWIGEFNLKPLQETCTDQGIGRKVCSGTGTIEVDFLSSHQVEYSDIVVDTTTGKVVEGQANMEFPGGIDIDVMGGFITVTLASITFTPETATCSGYATGTFPFTSSTFPLSFENLYARKTGLSGHLVFENQVTFDVSQLPGFEVRINGGSKFRLSHNTIVSSTIAGKILLPEVFLRKGGSGSGFDFSNLTIDSTGATVEFSLPSSLLGGTNLSVQGTAVLDLSTMNSPEGVTPQFLGLYFKDCKLRLPSSLGIPDITITGFYIDGTGVNGSFSTDDLNIQFENGGFRISVTSFSLSFTHNSISGSKLSGQVTIPYIDASLDYDIAFDGDGLSELVMTTKQDRSVTLAQFIKITLKEGSEVKFIEDLLRADMSISVNGLQDFPIPLTNLAFHLIIDSAGNVGVSEFSGGSLSSFINLGSNQSLDFGGIFPFTLEKVGMKVENSALAFLTSGKISLSEVLGLVGEGGGAEMTISASKNGITVSDVNVAFDDWGITFDGYVSWGSDRFSGRLEMGVVDLLTATADITIGNENGVTYWKVWSDMALAGTGIPLGALPVSIYGFNGGAYYNMVPQRDEDSHRITGMNVSGGSFGFLAGADLGTNFDNGYTWNGSFFMEIAAGNVGGNGETSGFVFSIRGDSYLFSSLTNRGSNKITTEISFGYDEANFGGAFFYASLGIHLDYHGVVRIPASGSGTAQAELLFSADEWYVNIGTKESPISLKALYIFDSSGYFDIDSGGIFLGFRQGVSAEGSWWIFYAKLDAGISGDAGVGYNPFYVFGQVAAWIDLEAGVDIWLGRLTIFDAGVYANLGVRAPNPSKIWGRVAFHFSVLGGLVSGEFSAGFAWTIQGSSVGGEEGGIELPLPVATVIPAEGATNVSLAPNLRARFPFQAEEVQRYGGGIMYKIDYIDAKLYKIVSAGGGEQRIEVEPIPGNEGKGISSDGSYCYFRPLRFLDENSTYEFEVQANMMISEDYGSTWQEYWRSGYRTTFTSRFTTGEISPIWNAYVDSTYPRPGQKHVFTSSNVYLAFRAGIPDGYSAIFYRREGGLWTQLASSRAGEPGMRYAAVGMNQQIGGVVGHQVVSGTDISWDASRRKITVKTLGASGLPGRFDPNTTYKLAVVENGTSKEVYRLIFTTGSYGNFRELMEASPINARVGTGSIQGSANEVEVRTVDFETAEPIFWKDVEYIEITPQVLGEPTVVVWRQVYWSLSGVSGQGSYDFPIPDPHDTAIGPQGDAQGGAPGCSDVTFQMPGGSCSFASDCTHFTCTGEGYYQVNMRPAVLVSPSYFDSLGQTNSILLSLTFDVGYNDFSVNTSLTPEASLWTSASILNTIVFDSEKQNIWEHITSPPNTYTVTITYRQINDSSSLADRQGSFTVNIPREAFQVYIPLIEETGAPPGGGETGGGQPPGGGGAGELPGEGGTGGGGTGPGGGLPTQPK